MTQPSILFPNLPADSPANLREQYVQMRGTQGRSVFDEAEARMEEMRANDVVNLPQRPEPEQNPFDNPLVMLGMALQGKSAEAISAASTIRARNKARTDRYSEQVLQAHNYRQLRQQRFATTLADLQTRAAQAELTAETQARQEMVSAERFERTQQLAEDREQRLEDAQAATLRAQTERDRLSAVVQQADSLRKDPKYVLFKDGLLALSKNRLPIPEALGVDEKGNIGYDWGRLPELSMMTPAERKEKLTELRSQMQIELRHHWGEFPERLAQEMAYLNANFDSAIDASDAQAAGEVSDEVGEGLKQLSFRETEAVPAEDRPLKTTSDVASFVSDFQNVLEAESLESLVGIAAGDEGGRQLTASEAATARGASVEVVGTQLREGQAKSKDYLLKPEGKANLLTLAREMAQEVRRSPGLEISGPKRLHELVKERLQKEFGLKPGYVNGVAVRRAVYGAYQLRPSEQDRPLQPKGTKF